VTARPAVDGGIWIFLRAMEAVHLSPVHRLMMPLVTPASSVHRRLALPEHLRQVRSAPVRYF
jgi:hypothetical protein